MLMKLLTIPVILSATACASPNFDSASSGVELARNFPVISIAEAPECKKKKLVYAADGSLWIK